MTSEQKMQIHELAMEQAIQNHVNEVDMDPNDAVEINRASLPTRDAQILFKHNFRRHTRNIAEGNPFYGCTE